MNPRPPFSCTTLTLTLHSFSLSNFSLYLFSSLFPFSFSSTPHPTLPVPHTLFLYSLSLEYPFGLLSHSKIQGHSSSLNFLGLLPPLGSLLPHFWYRPQSYHVYSTAPICSSALGLPSLLPPASSHFHNPGSFSSLHTQLLSVLILILSSYHIVFPTVCPTGTCCPFAHFFSSSRPALPLVPLFLSLSLPPFLSSSAPLSLHAVSTFRHYVSFSSFFLFFFLFSFILASVDSWVDRCTAFADTARKSGLTFSLYFCVVFRHLLG